MSNKKCDKFYSFQDAYEEAIMGNSIKTNEFFNKSIDMASIRRYFRSFLEHLSIDPFALKEPIQSPVDAQDLYNRLKCAPYKFDETMFDVVVDFIKNWKSFKYKKMRRGEFSKEFRDDYHAIITAVETNMELLGCNSEQIFWQTCEFWRNIVEGSNDNILSFLHINSLPGLKEDIQCNADSLTAIEITDYIYLDRQFVKAQHEFFTLWQQRIKKMSLLRKDNIQKNESQHQKSEIFTEDIIGDYIMSLDQNTPSISKSEGLALKKMEISKETFISDLQEMYNLIGLAYIHDKYSKFNNTDFTPIVPSSDLYAQVILSEGDPID